MIRQFLINLALFYRKYLSPLTPPSCRFVPTCSSYFIQSLEQHGFFKGIGLSIVRILKCHPLHPGGYDPVNRKR